MSKIDGCDPGKTAQFFNNYPYTNYHELNLDWIISQINNLTEEMKNFVIANQVKFANPIEWNNDTMYDQSTIVLGDDGNSYISLKTVPKGIAYTNTEYWEKIANFNAQVYALALEVEKIKSRVHDNLLEVADSILYAQHNLSNYLNDLTGFSAQGFEVFSKNNINYCVMSLVSDNKTVLSLNNLDTGNLVARSDFSNLGHCNGICYNPDEDYLYIATSGGTYTGGLVVVDTGLNYIKTVDFDSVNPSSVYYDINEKRYYCENFGTSEVVVFDDTFTILKRMVLSKQAVISGNVTYQALSGDDDYLYFVNNGLSYSENMHFNKIDIYTHNLTYVGSTLFDNIFELEQVKRFKDYFYFYVSTNNTGYVYRGNIFDSRTMIYQRDNYLSNIRLTTDSKNLWFKNDYVDFLSDGTFSHPISNIYIGATLYKKRYTRFLYNLIGDFSKFNVNIKGLPYTELQLHGYDTDGTTRKLVQVGGMYLEDMYGFSCDYIDFVSRNPTENNAVSVIHVSNAFFGHCSFSASNIDRMLNIISSNVTMRVNTISGSVNNYYLYATEGSYVSLENLTMPDDKQSVFRSGVNYVGSNPNINIFKKGTMNNTPFENIFYTNYNGAFLGITQPGTYYFTGGCNLTDLPDNLTKSVVIKVQWVSDSIVQYTLNDIRFQNEYVMAYNAINNTHGNWLKITRTSV